jgi:hypothetical protein
MVALALDFELISSKIQRAYRIALTFNFLDNRCWGVIGVDHLKDTR